MFSFTFLIIIICLKNDHTWSVEIKRIQYHLTIHLLHVDICKKKMTNYRSNWGRLLPICCHRELPSWTCIQTVSEEFLMAMNGILFCAYRLIFIVTSLTICNRFSFNMSTFNLVCNFFTLVLYSDGCQWIEN